MESKKEFVVSCPLPLRDYPKVLLAHGGGGKLTQQLIEKIFQPSFANPFLNQQHDGAVVSVPQSRIAMTTDSFVVKPLFFPGGNIGELAVYGTVNDLAMCGARPLYLTAGFIIEEGFSMEELWKIAQSMKAAAEKTGIQIIAGDTKVVERGKGDGVFITTAGVGALEHNQVIAPVSVKLGDAVILSGDIGRHGIAVMASREGLEFETQIQSDCAPLDSPVLALVKAGIEIHCLRDLTRGGFASALNEIAQTSGLAIQIWEKEILVEPQVQGACEILGLDPLYVANEGRFVLFLPEAEAEKAIQVLQTCSVSRRARRVGKVASAEQSQVSVVTTLGTSRIVDRLSGEQLPRIC